MMRAHQVENGIVVNTIVVTSLDSMPGLTLIAATTGSVGDTVVNGVAIPKPPPEPSVPAFVPKLNARLVLIGAGYWDDVVDFITAQGPIALAFLQDAQTMRRDNPLVNAWAAARGKTGELDGLFIAAAALNVDQFNG
jgi:hypothetical protein